DLGEGRLAGLEEQLAEPERTMEAPVGLDVDERLALGVEERESLPVLGVGGELQDGVTVRRVVLDVELVLLESQRLGVRWSVARRGSDGGYRRRAEHDQQGADSESVPHLDPPSGTARRY